MQATPRSQEPLNSTNMKKNSSTQHPRDLADTSRLVVTIAMLLVVTLTASACALIKVGYRNGDRVGLFMIDRYFDLSNEQEAFVKPRLHQLLIWHRRTQLPDYVAFATELQRQAPQPISASAVAVFNEQAKRRVMTMVDRAIPDLADLALTLGPANLKALQERFAEDDAKWRKEYMKGDIEAQKEARYDRTLDRTEEWYGRFSREQRATIRALSDARPFDNTILLAERRRRQREMVDLLTRVVRDHPSRDAVMTMLHDYANGFERSPDADQRAWLDVYRKATDEMNGAIHNLSTPEQRQRSVATLQIWIDDFNSLSSEMN